MKNLINNYIQKQAKRLLPLSLLIGSLAAISSCNYLDVVPDKVSTIENAFSNRHEAEKYLYTCYAYIPNHHDPGGNIGLMGADEVWTYYPITAYNDYSTWRISLGHQNINDPYMNYWSHSGGAAQGLYKGIRDCNIFIENLENPDNVGDLSPSLRRRWIAEVKFLKAYFHFYLMRMYGPIVIVDENLDVSSTPEEVRGKRAPVDEVVEYIADLLDETLDDLPKTIINRATELGRVTRPAALMLKAKLFVTAASPLFNGNSDYANFVDKDGVKLFNTTYEESKWEKAIAACKEAIELCHDPEVNMDLHKFVATNINLNEETVRELSLRNSVTDKWNEELIWGLSGRGVSGLQNSCMARIGEYTNNMWGAQEMLNPTIEITNKFYTRNGVPIEEDKTWDYADRFLVKRHYQDDPYHLAADYETVAMHFDRESRFYASVAFDGALWYQQNCPSGAPADIWTAKNRSGQAQGKLGTNNYTTTGYWLKKLVNWQYTLTQSGYTTEAYPWPEFRLADLYLLYAEALNEIDNQQNRQLAIEYLDKIRERAGLSGVKESWTNFSTNPNKYTTQNGLREIIHQERSIELMFEGQRFWDIRRWKTAYNELNNKKVNGWNIDGETATEYYVQRTHFTYRFVAPRDYLWPIKEMDLIVNPNLVQNPGW